MPKPISIKLIFISLLIGFFFYSCSPNKNFTKPYQPGVVITFDDYYINEWCAADAKLSSYKWKATFFVSNLPLLKKSDYDNLRKLKKNGHEIGGHGYNHLNAKEYTKTNGKSKYITLEITPLIETLKNEGLPISSFAYPFGANNQTLNFELKKYFKIIRSTSVGKPKIEENSNFYNGTFHQKGIGIDGNYKHFTLDYIKEDLAYARRNNKIVILYAHKPVQKSTSTYEVEMKTLETICQYVTANHMKFYTFQELTTLKK